MAKINGHYGGDYIDVSEDVTTAGLVWIAAATTDYDGEVATAVSLDRDGLVRLACAALQAVEAMDRTAEEL